MTTDTDHPEPSSVAVFAPALLLAVEVHRSADGRDEVHFHAGGQGYWVSKMVQALGSVPIPCAPVGGEAGEALRSLIAADGLEARLTSMNSSNAVVIDDRRPGGSDDLVELVLPTLGRHEMDELYSTIVGAALSAGVCVLAGTHLAPMFEADHFRRLVTDLRRHDVVVVVDVCGEPLTAALDAGVGIDVVKLSHDELIADGWAVSASRRGVIDGMQRLHDAGARSVVVSRRERSTLASDQGNVFEVRSPVLEVLDGRGGGDSITAALAVAESRRLPFVEALQLAAAAAALNVSRHGLGTGRRDAIEDVARRVEVVGVSRSSDVVARASDDLVTLSRAELYRRAADAGVAGRSRMTRSELIAALTTAPSSA
jgi:1-phosphofructokinase